MARSRPRPVLFIAFGILNILMGVLFLTCGVCGGLSAASKQEMTVNGRDVSAEYQAHMANKVPAFTAFRFGDVGLRFLMGLGFIAAGVGLWLVSRWGHVLALLFAAAAVLHQLVVVLWQVVFISPARREWLKTIPIIIDLGFFATMEMVIVVAWAALILLYCLGLVIVLVLPSTFRTIWGRSAKTAEDEDDEDDRPRRRRRLD